MPLQFDRTIKAGDILSSLTVLLSVVALVLSLSKDRAVRVTDQANKVRTAAASVIVKLDRWQAVQLSMYQDLQPVFVELSEDLAKSMTLSLREIDSGGISTLQSPESASSCWTSRSQPLTLISSLMFLLRVQR